MFGRSPLSEWFDVVYSDGAWLKLFSGGQYNRSLCWHRSVGGGLIEVCDYISEQICCHSLTHPVRDGHAGWRSLRCRPSHDPDLTAGATRSTLLFCHRCAKQTACWPSVTLSSKTHRQRETFVKFFVIVPAWLVLLWLRSAHWHEWNASKRDRLTNTTESYSSACFLFSPVGSY